MRMRIVQSSTAQHLGDPLSWPELTNVYRRMTDVLERRRREGGESSVTVHAEVDLVSKDELLFGRLDAYFLRGNELELVDYKAGAVLDGERPREEYVEQLYFYAYLLEQNLGRYPTSLQLVGRDGVGIAIEPSPGRSNALAGEMKELLAAYNSHAATGIDASALASPGASACASCDLKPTCAPFWDALSRIQLPAWAHVAVGVVARPAVRSRLGACSFDLKVTRSSLGVSDLKVTRMFEDRYPGLTLDRMVGRELMITGLRRVSERTATVAELTDRSLILPLECDE